MEINTDNLPGLEDEIEIQEMEQNTELNKPEPPLPTPKQSKHKVVPDTGRLNSRHYLQNKL